MNGNEIQTLILDLSIKQWNSSFGGISALNICDKIPALNEEVMKEMEILCEAGKGTINRNVKFYLKRIDLKNPKSEIPLESIITHIFFPNKELLEEHFYGSGLVREKYPEYKNRLHCGAHQLGLVMFSEEVLARYFDHPEYYEVDDSLSGGHILAKPEAPKHRYLYVRHGKGKLEDGRAVITAMFKDLYVMSPEEQRHWHAYEIQESNFSKNDPNFARFVARTYEGAYVDYPNPIQDVLDRISVINGMFVESLLFRNTQNEYFRIPVENTKKAYCDCCSEFYKLIGNDSLNQNLIKKLLKEKFSTQDDELIHSDSSKRLSPIQLLELLQRKMGIDELMSSQIRKIGDDRTEAAHKITRPIAEENNYIEEFICLCQNFVNTANNFERKFRELTAA